MTITVARLKRACEEATADVPNGTQERFTLDALIRSPALLTILAERLSQRPYPEPWFNPSTSDERG